MVWSPGADPSVGGSAKVSDALRDAREADIAENQREEAHEREDYEAAKARAASAPSRSFLARILRRPGIGR